MRKSANYKGSFETRLKEIKRYVNDLELALANDYENRFWRTADTYSAYLRDAANSLVRDATEGALLNEIEDELAGEL